MPDHDSTHCYSASYTNSIGTEELRLTRSAAALRFEFQANIGKLSRAVTADLPIRQTQELADLVTAAGMDRQKRYRLPLPEAGAIETWWSVYDSRDVLQLGISKDGTTISVGLDTEETGRLQRFLSMAWQLRQKELATGPSFGL